MTFSRLHISIFVGVAAVVWWITLLVQGTSPGKEFFGPFSIVVSTLFLLGIAVEHRLWRHPRLQGWLVNRPDLRGTWRVELQSSYIDPKTNAQVPMIVCYMDVKQTLSTLQMHLMTPESESWFIADSIRPSPNGNGFQVVGVYTNKPKIHLRGDKSEMHLGALILDTHGTAIKPDSLTGEYWTDRRTTGQMTFSAQVPEIHTRYKDAERAFI